MLKIYFAAFVGTLFITIMAGVAEEAVLWGVLELFGAPQKLELIVGLLGLIPVVAFFIWYFPQVVEIETELAEQSQSTEMSQ